MQDKIADTFLAFMKNLYTLWTKQSTKSKYFNERMRLSPVLSTRVMNGITAAYDVENLTQETYNVLNIAEEASRPMMRDQIKIAGYVSINRQKFGAAYRFYDEHEHVYMQDENLKGWHKGYNLS